MSVSWRCFHCDEVFTDRREAWLHFGKENCASDVPACVDPLRHDEKARIKELREAHEHASKCQAEAEENDGAAGQVENMYSELRRYFGEDCNSVWLAGDRYKSAQNLIDTLWEQIAQEEEDNASLSRVVGERGKEIQALQGAIKRQTDDIYERALREENLKVQVKAHGSAHRRAREGGEVMSGFFVISVAAVFVLLTKGAIQEIVNAVRRRRRKA